MVENLNYLAAPLLLALFGLPAAFAPGVRQLTPAIRFVMSFMAGTIALVVWATLLAAFDVTWSASSVVLPLGFLSITMAVVLGRRGREDVEAAAWSGWDAVAIVIGSGAALHIALMAGTARSTSIDFFYFWGIKAVRFAEAGGFDVAYLSSPFSAHAHIPYPPLVPLVGAWGVDLVGRLPWRAGLVSMVMWVVLAYPIVLRGLRSRLPIGDATIASGVWMFGISLAVTSSFSAGSAEPPLLFFTTIAIVALVAREGTFPSWVAPLAACGIILTKAEGVVLWLLLVAGFALRDLVERRPFRTTARRMSGMVIAPPLALLPWIAFLTLHDLPLSDSARETIGRISLENLLPAVVGSLRYLEAGSGWLAWGLAVVVLTLSRRGWRTVLPALAIAAGILGFMLVYYLHYQGNDLDAWVRWTLPRVSLTALSAALIAAAVASGETAPAEAE